MPDDDMRSIAERRPRRMNRRLPARYRDILPQPPPPPMTAPDLLLPSADPQVSSSASSRDSVLGSGLLPRALRFFTTLANSFRLSRRYYGDRFPTHDPEDATTLQHLTLTPSVGDGRDSARHLTESRDSPFFYPYPNRSSFLLGDWYWNDGMQKSKKSFRELIKIVGAPEFRPEDVNTTRWDSINAQLRAGAEETGPDQPFEGAGWTKTAVTIKVPFHKRTAKPGVYDYHVGDMHIARSSLSSEKNLPTSNTMNCFTISLIIFFGSVTDLQPRSTFMGSFIHLSPFYKPTRTFSSLRRNQGAILSVSSSR